MLYLLSNGSVSPSRLQNGGYTLPWNQCLTLSSALLDYLSSFVMIASLEYQGSGSVGQFGMRKDDSGWFSIHWRDLSLSYVTIFSAEIDLHFWAKCDNRLWGFHKQTKHECASIQDNQYVNVENITAKITKKIKSTRFKCGCRLCWNAPLVESLPNPSQPLDQTKR